MKNEEIIDDVSLVIATANRPRNYLHE